MQKIEIEFKQEILKIYLIVKEKNLDQTLLNTNIISNEKLLFSLDYIKKNQKLVSSFLKEIILEKKTNTILCNDMEVISTVGYVFKNTPIAKVLMNTNDNFTYNAYEAIKSINALKEVECNSIPTYLIELFDKENIKVVSKQEVLFSSQFMANNDLNNYSSIFYAKSIKLMCPIVNNDYNDLTTFFKINKYLKTIELYRYLTTDLLTLIDLLKTMRIKNITIAIHDNITDKDVIERLKVIKKENKKAKINITLFYSNEYIESNYIKQLIATTIKSCAVIIISLSLLAFSFVFYNNKKSEENATNIKNDITDYLDDKISNLPDTPTPPDSNDNQTSPDSNPNDNKTPEETPTNPDDNTNSTPEDTRNPIIVALKELNDETVGWLNVPGTNIDYPVVKAKDNAYYLRHNFKKEKDYNGWVFMNYLNSAEMLDKNTIIFAHNRYYSNIMFGTLNKVGKKAWYQNIKENLITYSDINQEMKWEVFAAYTVPVTDDYLVTNFSTDDDFHNFIQMIRGRSVINSDLEIKSTDKILTLSTCADINTRFVVHAVLRTDLLKNN